MFRKSEATLRRWMSTMGLGAVVTVLAATALLLTSSGLVAEPYFTVREGYKCSRCHVNRTGGGMRTDYAKDYLESRAAMSSGISQGANGAASDFAHGRFTDYFAVSADVRALAEGRKFDGAKQNWEFGRPATCESCHNDQTGGGKLVELNEQLSALPGKASIVLGQSLQPKVSIRDAYALLETDTLNGYLKAGIFRMPSGLRNTWDDPYLHGTVVLSTPVPNVVGLEGMRGDGVEIGIEPGPYSLSFSVTNPGNINQLDSAPPKAKRVHLTGYGVWQHGLVGFTAYHDPIKETLERDFRAVFTGMTFGRVTGMLEGDYFRETDPTTGTVVKKGALFAEIDLLVARGHNIKWQYEAFDPDRTVTRDRSDRTSLIYEPFITPYLQVRTGARRSEGPRDKQGLNGSTIFVEVHLIY